MQVAMHSTLGTGTYGQLLWLEEVGRVGVCFVLVYCLWARSCGSDGLEKNDQANDQNKTITYTGEYS